VRAAARPPDPSYDGLVWRAGATGSSTDRRDRARGNASRRITLASTCERPGLGNRSVGRLRGGTALRLPNASTHPGVDGSLIVPSFLHAGCGRRSGSDGPLTGWQGAWIRRVQRHAARRRVDRGRLAQPYEMSEGMKAQIPPMNVRVISALLSGPSGRSSHVMRALHPCQGSDRWSARLTSCWSSYLTCSPSHQRLTERDPQPREPCPGGDVARDQPAHVTAVTG